VSSAEVSSAEVSSAEVDVVKQKRRGRRRILVAAAALIALAAAGAIGYLSPQKHTITAYPPAAVLDGTYRLVYDYTKRTHNGAPSPSQQNADSLWAFRSLCGSSTGCVATGTKIDPHNPQVVLTPVTTAVLHFADGHWQEMLARDTQDEPKCLGADGKVLAGTETMVTARSLEPQADGTLRGVWTETVLTNECGLAGLVTQVPFVANRTGDTPTGIAVPDPAGVAAIPATSTPAASPVAGPLLNGAYRFDYDKAHQTVNGEPTTGGDKTETHWWAFRSLCTSAVCVATGAALADNNQNEPSGASDVVQFIDGSWKDMPSLLDPEPCSTGNGTGIGNQMTAAGWSFQPKADGTLRGVSTVTVLTNECGHQGYVYATPLVVTRTGDVPPSVVLADPALF
jgi:serine/threonine protein kinase, bacterial